MADRSSYDAQGAFPHIAGYRIARVIGEGGMSTVYLGTQLSLGREVAIKVMRPEALADEVSRRRFENEARTIARLEHPHIVGIHEVGRTADGLPWYAMPHLPRGHVGQRDLRGDQQRICEILHALLSALGFAHARGVVHRDVKAENVLFDEADRPLLADFGIALRRGHGTRVTMTGLAVGSTAYMAPEQARGQQVDHRADLYSVGVLAWEMLTGALPYQADDALAMAIQHTQNPIPRLPPELRHWQRFIDRAMAKSPRKRFHDAQQMRAALDSGPAAGRRTGAWLLGPLRQAGDVVQRTPRTVWIPVGLACAAILGWLLHGATPMPAAANGETAEQSAAAIAPPRHLPVDPPVAQPDGDNSTAGTDVAASAMHAAAPLSPADLQLQALQAQIESGELTAAAGQESAADRLVAAWRADPAHPQLQQAATALYAALATASIRAIARDRVAETEVLLADAQRARSDTGAVPAPAIAQWRDAIAKALDQRVRRSASEGDRDAATRSVDQAAFAGLPAAAISRLRNRAGTIAARGGREGGDLAGMILLEGATPLAASPRPVSRAEYARFAEVNGREPALCRERISLLRVLDPRNWQEPGFEQGGDDPVVCVSWADAEAYAQWRGRRDGRRYRLATVEEAARLPAAVGERVVSEWRADCASDCNRRAATGPSWRTQREARTLDPERGYDDVGFRLVREL